MTIKELLSKLEQNTQNDSIEWINVSSGGYRFLSDNGAVKIVQLPNGYYEIKLYDKDSCFASYRTYEAIDIDQAAGALYQAIVSSINRGIERRIENVFSGV